jgi:hypothetical protein
MNRWQVLGASIVGIWVAAACSDSSTNEPTGQSGDAGAPQGGKAGAAGGANVAGKAGGGQQGGAGSAGGKPQGGSSGAGSGGAAEGGEAGAGGSGPYEAVQGELCPVEAIVGVVQLAGFPAPYVQVTLHDRTDPWIGEAELTTETCGFHRFTAHGCPTCDSGQVCSLEGECVPERRTVKQAELRVRVGAVEREYEADPEQGGIYSQLDIGDADSSYAMTLSWGDTEVRLAAMPVASGNLGNPAVTIEGDSALPGALDATWDPASEGAFVRSRIPINHHAGGPTFTECAAPDSSGGFHADAEMIDPLAVHTGLEFQGLEHVFVAAATTPQGCVEFRFGPQLFVFPE